ncbi:carbohydrate ABC transporter permease [Paenibacillus gansuensis]|uniref:Carbohydrate ABC transporter permease n=1 Tax=Paenibacillus gansuensis TaxID=306542 RepID=A0ABW5PG33_9BACL
MGTGFMRTVRTFDVINILFLLFISLVSFVPILHTIALSLSKSYMVEAGMVGFFPKGWNIHAYERLLDDKQFLVSFWVSVKRVALTVVSSFIVTLLLAFPLSRDPKQFILRNPVMWLLIFTLLFNGGLIPFYMTVRDLGLYDTMGALVLPMIVNVFNVILVVNFFRSIPKELDECSSMDGAGPFRMLISIYLPLSLPVLATISLFSIVNTWNEYLFGLIFTRSQELMPLQTYLQTVFVKLDPTRMTIEQIKEAGLISNKSLNAAKILLSLLPIFIVYPFMQRFFIHGIVLGSVKE